MIDNNTNVSQTIKSRKKMNVLHICLGILVLVSVCESKAAKHGAQEKLTKDGERNVHYDHEAFLEIAKKKLRILAKQMDTNGDGQISEEELVNKIMHSFKTLDMEDGQDQFKELDVNKDGFITWKEYKDTKYNYDESSSSEEDKTRIKKEMDEDRKKFNAADQNHDNQLTIDEFMAFHLPHHFEHMWDNEIDRQLEEHDTNYTAEKKKEFDKYDLNKDGYLDRKEMRPWSVFDDRFTATEEAQFLIKESDANKDGQLSYDEIVDNHEHFVGSQATDYGSLLHRLPDEL
ncbi:hypothetical protein KUTeg_015820 [Tegillarca granosa]|uniref:EF-hand domain-containing protein n=1 Tax=Tegillarca granosa TaxID=220873 RepID=A0ABQ9ENY7_TEGGR|nr:hypothetical protein KUTeg_015820 [Tegillarca granosa]